MGQLIMLYSIAWRDHEVETTISLARNLFFLLELNSNSKNEIY